MMTRKDYVSVAKIVNDYLKKADYHDALGANVDDFLIDPEFFDPSTRDKYKKARQ